MNWIVRNIDWIAIVSGAGTFGVILMAAAPRWAVRTIFGEDITTSSALFIARSWGAMIAASGLMLIYTAWHPEARLPVFLYSIVGKLGFIGLVIANGGYRKHLAPYLAVGDGIIVLLLAWYLLAAR